jgi:hypothetical protein
MKPLIVTNNPKVLATHPSATWIDGCPRDVLLECRRMVHGFHPLLTHPLMGDIRLLRNPHRTVLLGAKGVDVDIPSLSFIEESIARTHSLVKESPTLQNSRDYQAIDFDLAQMALRQVGS